MKPVRISRVSQPFADPGAYASDTDRHGPAGHHTGIDYGSAWPIPIANQKVRTIVPGQVVISDYNSTMGNWVGVYYHDRNMLVTYWHLSKRFVSVGDWVQVNQAIGRVGSTGNSSAAHLHLQVNYGSAFNYDGHIHPALALQVFPGREARKRYRRARKHPNAR